MKLVVYYGKSEKKGHEIVSSMEDLISGESVEIHATIDGLSNRLRKFCRGQMIVIIITASRNELMNVVLLKDLLTDIPTILILPDHSQETFSKGAKLVPRYVSYIDSDFREIRLVMEKILTRYEKNNTLKGGSHGQYIPGNECNG